MTDVTMSALTSALNALSLRQRVIANNVANIQTPGFTAQQVSFEEALASQLDAVSSGDADPATLNSSSLTSIQATSDPSRLDGNNVNLDTETLNNIDTGLRYQLMLRAVDSKFATVRDVLRTT